MVEHSAVNRRVASSNLARGAILLASFYPDSFGPILFLRQNLETRGRRMSCGRLPALPIRADQRAATLSLYSIKVQHPNCSRPAGTCSAIFLHRNPTIEVSPKRQHSPAARIRNEPHDRGICACPLWQLPVSFDRRPGDSKHLQLIENKPRLHFRVNICPRP